MGVTDLGPIGTVRVGNMKEDFSLEEMTSSKYIVFMERALPALFNPARNVGISGYNTFLAGRLATRWAAFTKPTAGFSARRILPDPPPITSPDASRAFPTGPTRARS